MLTYTIYAALFHHLNFMEEARDLIKYNKKAYVAKDYPNATGNTQKPKEIFGKKLIRRYLQGLKISDIEKMFFEYENLSLKIVGLSGAGTSLDLDSARDEKKMHDLSIE